MTIENDTNGLGNRQTYGQRSPDEGRFSKKTRRDSQIEFEIGFHGDDFTEVSGVIPEGFLITEVLLKVGPAFVLGGTTPALEVGTSGSEATNGFTITEAQLENDDSVVDLTGALSGTWAAILAADTTLNVVLSGSTPTITAAGQATVKIMGFLA